MKISLITLLPFCGLMLISQSCNDGTSNEVKKTDSSIVSTNTNHATTSDAATTDGLQVAFKVNGIAANTQTRNGDSDEASGMFNYQTQQLVLSFLGDDPKQPHRGWINFGIDKFQLAPGNFNASSQPAQTISFSRYGTENAGEEVMYNGKEFQLKIEKLEKDPASESGNRYWASGSFSATLEIKPEYKFQNKALYDKSDKTILITDGKFEKIPLLTLGKKS
ncbi:MAG: hypothetical protein RLY16_3058 [Bacteroidota bacterium]|jgi:hypothetical protein